MLTLQRRHPCRDASLPWVVRSSEVLGSSTDRAVQGRYASRRGFLHVCQMVPHSQRLTTVPTARDALRQQWAVGKGPAQPLAVSPAQFVAKYGHWVAPTEGGLESGPHATCAPRASGDCRSHNPPNPDCHRDVRGTLPPAAGVDGAAGVTEEMVEGRIKDLKHAGRGLTFIKLTALEPVRADTEPPADPLPASGPDANDAPNSCRGGSDPGRSRGPHPRPITAETPPRAAHTAPLQLKVLAQREDFPDGFEVCRALRKGDIVVVRGSPAVGQQPRVLLLRATRIQWAPTQTSALEQ